jgi:hypothetical protein
MEIKDVLILLLTIVTTIIGIIVKFPRKSETTVPDYPYEGYSKNGGNEKTYLTPMKFAADDILRVGKDYHTSNLCAPNILYPINEPDVDYDSKMPANCPMAIFLQSP